MRRPRAVVVVPLVLVVLIAIALGGIALAGGGDEETTTNPPPRDGVETPSDTTAPTSDPSALPPAFVKCMAEQGFEVSSPDEIHAAPPEVLQTCFAALHQGGGRPDG